MVRLRLTPGTASAGPTRVFHVTSFTYDTTSRQLVLTCRDGRICIEVLGGWEVAGEAASGASTHTIAEAERIHDGRSLVLIN